jgi:purine nucleosidase
MIQRVIIDTDIGTDVDDAYALAFLAKSPEIAIEAVTTVWADARLRARIAKKLLNLTGKTDIPVAVGEDMPLNPERPAFLMGHEGRGVFSEGEELRVSDTPAAELIEALLKRYPKEIKVLLIGPQTNFGKLLSERPGLAPLIEEFVVMGGTPFYGPREIELFGERPIDYNLVTDPESARVVFEAGVPITMVGVNVTMPTLLKDHHLDRIRQHGTPMTDVLYSMTVEWLRIIGKNETPMHDSLAGAAAFTLDFLDTMMLNVAIETKGDLTAGLTVVNRYDNEEWNKVRVAYDAKYLDFIEFMMERILA